jgi:hypothetical protein
MLDTAFHKNILSQLPKTRLRARTKSLMKTWSYVGRFMWGFATVEYQVNQLFGELLGPHPMNQGDDDSGNQKHGLGNAASLMLTYTLQLRKKVNLIQMILQSRGIDESVTFKRVHKLHDLRNVLAHWRFDEEADGISCDFMNERGDTDFYKPGTHAKDNMITYAELDRYDTEASELYEKLEELTESAIPITEPSEDLRNAMIEEAIRSSDNVLRFPVSHRDDNTDKSEQ